MKTITPEIMQFLKDIKDMSSHHMMILDKLTQLAAYLVGDESEYKDHTIDFVYNDISVEEFLERLEKWS